MQNMRGLRVVLDVQHVLLLHVRGIALFAGGKGGGIRVGTVWWGNLAHKMYRLGGDVTVF